MVCGGEGLPPASLPRSLQALDTLVSGSWTRGGGGGGGRGSAGGGGGGRTLRSIDRELSPLLQG